MMLGTAPHWWRVSGQKSLPCRAWAVHAELTGSGKGGVAHASLPGMTSCVQGDMLQGQKNAVLQAPACCRPHDPVHHRPQRI